ncbi:response regulator [Chryseolinea sp. T2]|uniref:hybrid sensor histidine kinase/response regulator n=1 Tax=Chryseolinea sp. T2 TaxID=3129255 RepID=UPI003076DBF0
MILIVDDNQENIFSLRSLLVLNNFDVDSASSGEEALRKIILNNYSLVILDVQMPDMDGFEVADAITGYSKSRDIPIIFLSAVNTHKKFVTKGYRSGGIDYVTKPFDPDILLLKVKTFYRLSEQTQQLMALEKSLRDEIEWRKAAENLLEQKVAERTRELFRSNQRLEQSNKELQQFVYVASHDLQEPLRKIQTFINICLERYLDDRSKIQYYFEKIFSSTKRLRNLITDLLRYSIVNAEEVFVKTRLTTILEETIGDLEFPSYALQPVIEMDDLPEIEVMPSQIRQVFQNLISNSLKFRKPDVPCTIHIKAERIETRSVTSVPSSTGDWCRITFRDNGIGFKQEYADKIFEIFQRLNDRDQFEGTGIGLSIVHKVVERHEGLIVAYAQENSGATFVIVLPFRHSSNARISKEVEYSE